MEVVDEVVAIVRTEDKRVTAAYVGTIGRSEIAPHVIRGTGSAHENVIPAYVRTRPGVGSITVEIVGAANSAYEGIVSPRAGPPTPREGIAVEVVDRVRSAREGIVPT